MLDFQNVKPIVSELKNNIDKILKNKYFFKF